MQMHKFETNNVQKYESKYEGPVPKYEAGSMPKYDPTGPVKFEPKFEAKYEPNLSVDSSQQSQINRNILTVSENARNILGAETNSISMPLMQ